ncbi:transcription cofactor vestigial-like protein 4b isoform X4 [Pangasianodon hypophthalmus]|uniref:transcription cofactor vestigial-like protein 4b isoform X4 n=1 Tax=Pangasianodon hypophthalmus TaxID=310915 RepID=UPI0023073945|nr:transcription cofactor vestigial-like protein 4b isoform X4 [Pangasianodon hypophthalmus]
MSARATCQEENSLIPIILAGRSRVAGLLHGNFGYLQHNLALFCGVLTTCGSFSAFFFFFFGKLAELFVVSDNSGQSGAPRCRVSPRMETPLDVLSRAASLVHADDEKREAALRGESRMQPMSSTVNNHRTAPPPISPSKRKHSIELNDDSMDPSNEHVAKMSRLFATHLPALCSLKGIKFSSCEVYTSHSVPSLGLCLVGSMKRSLLEGLKPKTPHVSVLSGKEDKNRTGQGSLFWEQAILVRNE